MGHHQLTVARPCQNRLDIVATQGTYLVPRADTPVFEKAYDENFATTLARKLNAMIDVEQIVRRAMYGQDADEWPIGHTPLEVKERRGAELRALEEAEGATSDDASDNDEEGDATVEGRVGAEKGQAAPGRASRTQPSEARWLPTPPLSAHSPIPTPHGTKRRRISTGDEEEKRPRKTHVTSTARVDSLEEVIPKGLQEKSRKRRRADDIDDEGVEDRERPTKARETAAATSRRRHTGNLIRSGAG